MVSYKDNWKLRLSKIRNEESILCIAILEITTKYDAFHENVVIFDVISVTLCWGICGRKEALACGHF